MNVKHPSTSKDNGAHKCGGIVEASRPLHLQPDIPDYSETLYRLPYNPNISDSLPEAGTEILVQGPKEKRPFRHRLHAFNMGFPQNAVHECILRRIDRLGCKARSPLYWSLLLV